MNDFQSKIQNFSLIHFSFFIFVPDDQIALLLKQLEEEKSKSVDLKRKLVNAESTIKNVRKIFRDDQLNRLENPESRCHWDDDMSIKNTTQDFTRMGFTGYECMRKRFQNAIPSVETL